MRLLLLFILNFTVLNSCTKTNESIIQSEFDEKKFQQAILLHYVFNEESITSEFARTIVDNTTQCYAIPIFYKKEKYYALNKDVDVFAFYSTYYDKGNDKLYINPVLINPIGILNEKYIIPVYSIRGINHINTMAFNDTVFSWHKKEIKSFLDKINRTKPKINYILYQSLKYHGYEYDINRVLPYELSMSKILETIAEYHTYHIANQINENDSFPAESPPRDSAATSSPLLFSPALRSL